jgi:orotidine-5'-phosphate decarboxylase
MSREQIAFAADLALEHALVIYKQIAPQVAWAKVGLSLYVEHGPHAVQPFLELGAKVFLDLKLHDIPNTVEKAAARAAELGVGLITVHASGGSEMLKAAVHGVQEGASRRGVPVPTVLAVTVLTSLNEGSMAELGWAGAPKDQVLRLARLATSAGVNGLVCSPQEVKMLRSALGSGPFLCTPGIRPAGSAAGDQQRTETPKAALAAGSSLLVIGRPLYQAKDPAAAAAELAAELS